MVYFAKPFYGVSKLWMSAKYMSNIKSIGALARLYCFVEICWNLHPFPELKNVFFANFGTFLKFSKCKALGDFLISFLEIVPLRGCLGGISQNWNFWNWFEILDIFRHWLLSQHPWLFNRWKDNPAFDYFIWIKINNLAHRRAENIISSLIFIFYVTQRPLWRCIYMNHTMQRKKRKI